MMQILQNEKTYATIKEIEANFTELKKMRKSGQELFLQDAKSNWIKCINELKVKTDLTETEIEQLNTYLCELRDIRAAERFNLEEVNQNLLSSENIHKTIGKRLENDESLVMALYNLLTLRYTSGESPSYKKEQTAFLDEFSVASTDFDAYVNALKVMYNM